MTLAEYSLLSFVSLFVIVDPIAAVPAFLAMTPADSVASRQRMALFICIGLVMLTGYGILSVAARGAAMLSPLAMKLVTRLMGLLLAAMAVQFVMNALEQTPFFRP